MVSMIIQMINACFVVKYLCRIKDEVKKTTTEDNSEEDKILHEIEEEQVSFSQQCFIH